jgi:hypothetical protein
MEDNYSPECELSSFDDLLPSTAPASPKQNPVAVSQPSQMTTLTTPADTEIEPSLMDVGDIDHIIAGYQGPVDSYCDYGNPHTVGSAASKHDQSLFRRNVPADNQHEAPDISDSTSEHLLVSSTRQGKVRRESSSPRGPSVNVLKPTIGARVEKSKQARSMSKALVNRTIAGSLAASTAAASADLPGTEIGGSEQPASLNTMESTWPQSFGLSAVSEWNSTAPNPPARSPQPALMERAGTEGRSRRPVKPAAQELHQEIIRNFCETLFQGELMSEQERELKVYRQFRAITVYQTGRTLKARLAGLQKWVERLRSSRQVWWHPPLNLEEGAAEDFKKTPPERVPIVEIHWKLCDTCFKNKGELLPSCASTGVLTCYCGVPS